MNVLVLHGSARVGGDTDTLVEHFVLGLDLQEADRIVHVRPIEMHIEHCRACLECEFGAGCIIDDDMQAVYPAFRRSARPGRSPGRRFDRGGRATGSRSRL